MPVDDLNRTVIPAHGTGIGIRRHPFVPDRPCPGCVDGNGKLAFPVKVAAGMSHFEVCLTGLFELDHIPDMRSDS